MRFFYKGKDGGPQSPVTGFWLVEIKWLFSIVLLRFNAGCRETFHSHAFNAWTWFFFGDLEEEFINGETNRYRRSWRPKFTPRELMHRVHSGGTSWCLSLRGPWAHLWREYDSEWDRFTTLTHGRRAVLS